MRVPCPASHRQLAGPFSPLDVLANLGACALLLFALLLPTGWPQVLVDLLVGGLR